VEGDSQNSLWVQYFLGHPHVVLIVNRLDACVMVLFLSLVLALPANYQDARRRVAEFVTRVVGTPYVYGGKSLKGLDCSGLIRLLWQYEFGEYIPHGSWRQHMYLKQQGWIEDTIPHSLALFFYRGTNPRVAPDRITHVGIIWEKLYNSHWLTFEARRQRGVDFYPREFPHPRYPTIILYNPRWR